MPTQIPLSANLALIKPAFLTRTAELSLFAFVIGICSSISCRSPEAEQPAVPQVDSSATLDPELITAVNRLITNIHREGGYGESYLELAKTYYANGLKRLAQQAFGKYASENVSDGQAWYYYAIVSHSLGDSELAEKAYKHTIELRPDYYPAYWQLARLQLGNGNVVDALRLTEHVARFDPTNELNLLVHARAMLDSDQAESAATMLKGFNFDTSVNSDYASHLLSLAERQISGSTSIATSSTTTPRQPVWDDPWQSELLQYQCGFAAERVRAQRLYQQGDVDGALQLCRRLLNDSRADSREWNLLGMCLFAQGAFDSAVQAMKSGLAEQPNDFNLNLNLANIYLTSNPLLFESNFSNAQELFVRAVELCPGQWEPHVGLGQIAHAQGRIRDALNHFERACILARSVQNCTWFRIFALLDLARYDEANQVLDSLPGIELDSPYVHFTRAFVMLRQKETERAKQELARISGTSISDAELIRRIELLQLELRATE